MGDLSLLNEQIDTCLFGTVHIGGHTANRYIVEQFVATYAHHVHRHLTGNELYAIVDGLLAGAIRASRCLCGS